MKDLDTRIVDKVSKWFNVFENTITIGVSIIIGIIIVIALVRVGQNLVALFITDIFKPENITFSDYQQLFARIMTLLISLEFMRSIIKVLKTHNIRLLVLDVILITALAIARKLIIYDYDKHQAVDTAVFGGLIVAIGVFYFLVKYQAPKTKEKIE